MADFYVAPTGDDANPGTQDQPFATLGRARDAVRQTDKRHIHVAIRGGVYRVPQTIVFSLADSAPEGGSITYAAHDGEQPVFSAGVPVTGWQKLPEPPDELPAAAHGNVWVAPLPEGLGSFKTLFDGDARLPRARCKGFIPAGDPKARKSPDPRAIEFPAGAMRSWANLPEVDLTMITGWPWTMNILPMAHVDEEQGVAMTAIPGTYELIKPRFGDFKPSAWVENALCELDSPGEWVVDSEARRIYYWPTGDAPGDSIVAPAVTEMIRIEGDVDYDGPTDRPVRGLVFRGLTFTHADRYAWVDGQKGWGIQHDWEMFDRPTAMVRLRGAERCAFEQCRFTNAGATAVRLDLHCRGNTIDRSVIEHVGGVGVLLAGYGPGTKDVNRNNRITRNHIHHIGELYWHSPAIFVWQSGENVIANNLIHNTPYTGIVVSGRIGWDRNGKAECSRTVRWSELESVLGEGFRGMPDWEVREQFLHGRKNQVVRNEIRDVMEVMTDGNGIYVSGAGRDNVVRENFIHDCPSEHFAEGIRCDDDQYETRIDRNVIWRLGGMASFITIKGRNDVTNNIMAEPLNPPVRGLLTLEIIKNQVVNGSNIQRNIFYTTRKGDKICFQGQNYYGTTVWLHEANADNNLYHNTADPTWGRAHLDHEQKNGSEVNSIVADPLFFDPANGDFRLRDGSPALELGFEPIDLGMIGLPD